MAFLPVSGGNGLSPATGATAPTSFSSVSYASELSAAQLVVSSPWWPTIMREETGWLRRAQRVHTAVNAQAHAFYGSAADIKRYFVTAQPPKNEYVVALAQECSNAMVAMGNTFVVISTMLKRILDSHNTVLLLEKHTQDPFMANIWNVNDLLSIARAECSMTAEFYETRFPLLASAVQACSFTPSEG